MVRTTNGNRKMIVMMNSPVTIEETIDLIETTDTLLSRVVRMNEPMISHALSQVIRSRNMIIGWP